MLGRPMDATDADALRIANLRARKEERRKRFQDVKTRAMGIDKDYVAAQAEEKALKAAADKEADKMLAAQNAMVVDLLSRQQHEEMMDRKIEADALQRAQLDQIAEKASRSDPYDVKNDELVDPDTVGPSAMLGFAGEDPSGAERRRVQQQQMKDWADQQHAAKVAAAADEKQADMDYAAYIRQVDELRGQVEAEEQAAKQAARDDFRAENERLQKMRAELRAAEREADAAASRAEEDHKLSQIEDPSAGASALGAHRIRRDHYKGMSQSQIADIYAENQRVIDEKKAAKAADKAEDMAWAAHQQQLRDHMAALEAENAAEKRRANLSAKDDIIRQRVEQETMRATSRTANSNPVGAEFFSQFGTSDR